MGSQSNKKHFWSRIHAKIKTLVDLYKRTIILFNALQFWNPPRLQLSLPGNKI